MKKERRLRKSAIFKIVLLVIVILLIGTIAYKIYQVKSFQKDLRPITETEKQKVIDILNENMNITSSDIIFGNVITRRNVTLVQVEIKEGNLKKSYLINLDNRSLVRKYNEK